ncbi:hypothetical protein S40293_08011 [Stachybotrys chartarum IBT 40293]|nr:hypothetical protein S40293_08011 [Stachybotrys chartarum IBT 40293]
MRVIQDETVSSLAVVGISCRLPGGADDTTKLWEVLRNGTDTWSAVPDDRYNEEAFYHPDPDNPNGTTLIAAVILLTHR